MGERSSIRRLAAKSAAIVAIVVSYGIGSTIRTSRKVCHHSGNCNVPLSLLWGEPATVQYVAIVAM